MTTTAQFGDTESPDRFTDWLREAAEPDWTAATEHRFVTELGEGTIDDAVFRSYLVQDYAFVRALTGAFGEAVAQAPTMAQKGRLVDFLGVLTDDEDDYFERAFDALDVREAARTNPERTDVTRQFEDLLGHAAAEGGYAETMAVLLAAEWTYRTWADRIDAPAEPFYLQEWVAIHDTAGFDSFVGWLRDEVDDCGPALSPARQQRVRRHFCRAMALERAFFDAAYE
jgi:thiaminase/transcriptional activator TenA